MSDKPPKPEARPCGRCGHTPEIRWEGHNVYHNDVEYSWMERPHDCIYELARRVLALEGAKP